MTRARIEPKSTGPLADILNVIIYIIISDILLWIPSHGRAKEGQPARTYVQQLCVDTGCSFEDLPGAMDDRDELRERVSEISEGEQDDDDHHHHVMPQARISLTLSRHLSLSFISSGRSSGRHPVSSHSCCMYVRASRPAFARPYVGVHRSTSLMSSSLLLQQCPACLVRLTWIVFVMGGRWSYSWCLLGCCR